MRVLQADYDKAETENGRHATLWKGSRMIACDDNDDAMRDKVCSWGYRLNALASMAPAWGR